MNLVTATPPLVKQTLRLFLQRHANRRLLGLRARGPWNGPDQLDLGDDLPACHIAWCPSPLAIREQLASRGDESELLVLLTECSDQELGDDIRSHLPKRRLAFLDPWAALQQLHQVRSLSPRLRHRDVSWLAEELLRVVQPGDLEVEATGFLSEPAAWNAWLESGYGIPGGGRQLVQLLDWLSSQAAETWAAAPERDREAIRRQLGESVGVAGRVLLHLLDQRRGEDALPLGLICRVVFEGPSGEADERAATRREVAARLEAVFGTAELDADAAGAWADAAESRLERLWQEADDRAHALTRRADQLLEELRGLPLADRSDYLEAALGGRRLRLARAATSASEMVTAGARADRSAQLVTSALREAEEATAWLLTHQRFARGQKQQERRSLEMAVRLLRWLASEEAAHESKDSLPRLADSWARNTSFADWARTELDAAPVDGATGGPELDRALRKLLGLAADRRQRENELWGRAVQRWFRAPASEPSLVPIENILDQVVAPLARQVPVLLVVIDGMSLPTFHELMRELQHDWMQIGPAGERRWGLAPLPSVTAIARTSLLSGRLVSGQQGDEVRAFTEHPRLLEVSTAGREPRLFHKADLRSAEGTDLAPAVLEALADETQRVVAAVINATDDHLYKGDQIKVRWSLDSIRPLGSLLSAAHAAERTVILTADHGHILDRGTASRKSHGGGERWRPGDVEPEAGEIRVEGPRVVTESQSIVVPWSETVRYGGARRNGYHGGATPQELLVPLAVLTASEHPPDRWQPVEGHLPDWWEGMAHETDHRERPHDPGSETATRRARTPGAKSRRRAEAAQFRLFDKAAADPTTTGPATTGRATTAEDAPAAGDRRAAHGASWIEQLLNSEGLKSQLEPMRFGDRTRAYLADLLPVIDRHGGTLTFDALRRSLNAHDHRLDTILAASTRALNLDGYEILEVDRATDSVRLHRGLLRTQFELEDAT